MTPRPQSRHPDRPGKSRHAETQTFRFQGGNAVVTGAASGMGEHLASAWPPAAAAWRWSTGTGQRLRDVAAAIAARTRRCP